MNENELFKKYGPKIETLVRARLGWGNCDWEDFASEVKQALLVKLREGSVQTDEKALTKYINGIIKNKKSGYLKEKYHNRKIVQITPEIENTISSEEMTLEEKENRKLREEALAKCTKKLNKEYQKIFLLKYDEEMSAKQIGELLGISNIQVGNKLFEGRRQLKKCLQKVNIAQYFSF